MMVSLLFGVRLYLPLTLTPVSDPMLSTTSIDSVFDILSQSTFIGQESLVSP
jgi:hypothetical protein